MLVLAFLISSCNLGAEDVNEGMFYYSKGNYAKAKKHLLKANERSLGYYSEKEYYTILGNTCCQLNKLDSTKIFHRKALNIDPSYSEALVNLGVAHRKSGDFANALKCYTKANKINPDDAQLHTSLGSLYIHMDKAGLASKHLKKAINLDQDLVLAHSNYALALAHLGKFEKAAQELKLAESMGYQNGHKIRQKIDALTSKVN